jgi:hypothetical protein
MDESEQKKLSPDDAEKEKQAAFSIVKPLQTYERDIAESIRKTNASVASINVMEQKKKAEEKERPAHTLSDTTQKVAWGGVATLTSILLILAAVGVLGWLYYAYESKPPIVTTPEYSVISTDQLKKVDATDAGRDKLIKILTENLKEGNSSTDQSLTEIKLTEKVIPKNSAPETPPEEKQITSEQFISLLGGSAPASLARAFEGPWIFGFYKTDHAEPFILANISSFDNAFDGMIRWEKSMADDLEKVFLEYEGANGTSTEKIVPDISGKSFEDLVIKSKNARVLKNARNETVLLYSFLSEKYILITVNENVFKEVLNRFLTSKLVR